MEHIPEQQIDSIIKLFVTWNNHQNAEVGDRMADRFEKWFDCLTTIKIGENKVKKQVFTKVCQQFGTQLQQVTKPKDLVPFAYEILQTELEQQGELNKQYVLSGLTDTPEEVVQQVWSKLSATNQNLILDAYTNQKKVPQSSLKPLLQARYALKKLIFEAYYKARDFDWVLVSEVLDPDLIPLPLYESNALNNTTERQYFECWLINAPIICRDIQEFAPFAHALTQGCIQVEMKFSGNTADAVEIQKEDTVQKKSRKVANNPAPPQVQQNEQPVDSLNAIAKPVILLLLTAAALFGIYTIISGAGS